MRAALASQALRVQALVGLIIPNPIELYALLPGTGKGRPSCPCKWGSHDSVHSDFGQLYATHGPSRIPCSPSHIARLPQSVTQPEWTLRSPLHSGPVPTLSPVRAALWPGFPATWPFQVAESRQRLSQPSILRTRSGANMHCQGVSGNIVASLQRTPQHMLL